MGEERSSREPTDDLVNRVQKALTGLAPEGDAVPCDLPFPHAWNATIPLELRIFLVAVREAATAMQRGPDHPTARTVSNQYGVAHLHDHCVDIAFWPWRGCGSREWELELSLDEVQRIAGGTLTSLGVCRCSAPGCQRTVRRPVPWCGAHAAFLQDDGSFEDPRERQWAALRAAETGSESLESHRRTLQLEEGSEQPLPRVMLMFVQHLDDMLRAVEAGNRDQLEDPASVSLCYAFSCRPDLLVWEVQHHPDITAPGPAWDILMHRDEMAAANSEQLTALEVTNCRHPECDAWIRRRSLLCRVHELASASAGAS